MLKKLGTGLELRKFSAVVLFRTKDSVFYKHLLGSFSENSSLTALLLFLPLLLFCVVTPLSKIIIHSGIIHFQPNFSNKNKKDD